MLKRIVLTAVILMSLSAAGWLVITTPWASGDESTASKVEKAMQEEAAKPRFTGRLGDFEVAPRTEEAASRANPFGCKDGEPTTMVAGSEARLAAPELWADAFDTEEGVGWECAGQGIVLVNNQGLEGATTTGEDVVLIRGYFSSIPVPVLRDAPRDRLELISIEGRNALIEDPIEGHPYGTANLVVIERYPSADKPGILLVVERASSSKRAIEIAGEIIP